MKEHRVSVIIPTFNRGHLIGRALRSVLDQTHPVDEVIVVDDGSEDDTADVVGRLANVDPRIRYVQLSHAGASAARNAGVAATTGSLIAFQDSDDEWKPTFIEELLVSHDRPNVVAFSSMLTIDEDGSSRVDFPTRIAIVESTLAKRNCISTQSALTDAQLLRSHPFDERLPRLQDWDLWLGLVGTARFTHRAEPLVVQYLQRDSITAGRRNLYLALRTITRRHWRILLRHPATFVRLWVAARVKSLIPSGSDLGREGRAQGVGGSP